MIEDDVNPIRVAHVVGKMVGGGVEAVVMNYYRHIDRSRIQFDFLVDADSTLVPKDEIEALGGRVIEVPPYQHQFDYQRELLQLFRSEQWEIVHSHVNALSVFSLCAAKHAGVPIRIAHSHSTAGKGEYVKNALKAILKTQSNRYPTHRLACGTYAGEWLFGKSSAFTVLHNAVDLNQFSFDSKIRVQMREELGIIENQFVVGNIGRLMKQKNHRCLIDIFERILLMKPDSKLVLVGEGGLKSEIEELIASRRITDSVLLLGQRDDANRLYQAFDVFVLPSLYEGLPVVAVEAQMAGLPCFFSDTITKEIELTNNAHFLSIDSEPGVWAEAIVQTDMRKRKEADKSAFKDYDISSTSSMLCEYYHKILCASSEGN